MPPVGRIPTPGPARHSLAPSRWAGPQSAAGKAAEELDAAGVFVSASGKCFSGRAKRFRRCGDSTMGTNWASPFSVSSLLGALVPADEGGG